MIYLDNAATTAVDMRIYESLCNDMFNSYGNAGSIYPFGTESKNKIESARKSIARFIHTDDENIIFTSSGSEANTLAIIGMERYLRSNGYNHLITSKYEHRSVLNAMKEMEHMGFDVTYLDVYDGIVSCEQVSNSIREDTGLVSIMYVNNEIGTINDVKRIYEVCSEAHILFHTDCVQAFGTEPIDMDEIADMITISGHKVHAPKGVGCLCTKYKKMLNGIICGGGQEFGLRPGTENMPAIAAFGAEVDLIHNDMSQKHTYNQIDSMKHTFINKISELCNDNGILFSFTTDKFNCKNTSPKIVSVRFDGIDAESLVLLLGVNGVCVSAGSACNSHSSEPSHVLTSIGLSDLEARSTIRISFSDYNTITEIKRAASIIVSCVNQMLNK